MYEELLNDFDESGLDPNKTVIRCSSQYEANVFLKYLCAKGVWDEFSATRLIERWDEHKQSTCYHLSSKRWCSDFWYEEFEPSFRIVDFCDIYIGNHDIGGNPNAEVIMALTFDELMRDII